MTKKEFISRVAEKSNMKINEVNDIFTVFCQEIVNAVKEGEKVQLPGVGTFEKVRHEDKERFNPATKEKVVIKAHNAPKFKFSSIFKEAVR